MIKQIQNIAHFEEVYKEYYIPLVNFINKFLNNIENSKDVVQLTFVKIWQQRDVIDVKTSLKSYLFQMTKNTMIDYIRANKKHRSADDSMEVKSLEIIDHVHEDALDPYLVRQALDHCLKDLKPKAREIWELNKYEGLTYEEIANYLNISKRSVEDNISKISKMLKENLKNHPDLFD
ncbi:MAG: sigma-70 family RNA polymerase sigma factor [Lewinellaceae bacterium]|nr:sigma-70 family RNA polymerase sigma factor [Lewinellaceae bacterium]